MYLSKRTIRNLMVFFMAFIALEFVPVLVSVPSIVFHQLKNCVFCVLWLDTINKRIVQPRIRKMLMIMAFLFIFLSVMQAVKYEDNNANLLLDIHLWYLYYVSFIFVPTVSFLLTLDISDKLSANRRISVVRMTVLSVSVILLLAVLANDRLQLVFSFFGDRSEWSPYHYSNGILFFVIWIYLTVLYFSAFALTAKSFSYTKRIRFLWIPALIMSGLLAYSLFYNTHDSLAINGVKIFHIQSVFILCNIGYWESIIDIGIITSNSDYDVLFFSTHMNAVITDRQLNTVYRSEENYMIPTALKQKALSGPVAVDYNTILRSAEIKGGYVFWEDDVSSTRALEEELEETRIALKETNTVLEAENKIKEEQVQYEIQNQLYNSVDELTLYEKRKIMELITDDPYSDFNGVMSKCTVYGSFIKRMANLVLISGHNEIMDSDELYLSCRESFDYLRLCGVLCTVQKNGSADVNSKLIIAIYQILQEIIEEEMQTKYALEVYIDCSDSFVVRIMIDGIMNADEFLPYYGDDLSDNGGELNVTVEEGVTHIRISSVIQKEELQND